MNTENEGRYRGRGEPKNLTAVEARLRQVSRDTGDEERRRRHRLAVVVLANILSGITLDDQGERFLIKGGTGLMLRFGLSRSRFSKDLDAMLRGRVDPFLERLQEQGRTPHHGWTLTVAKVETIEVPGMTARPKRASVKMAYKGRPYSTVQLEIAPEEAGAAEEFDLATAEDLAELGFGEGVTTHQLLTVRFQVAQKLHACTTPRTDGKTNARAHDLVDIALLEPATRAALVDTRDACATLFNSRGSTQWPPTLVPEDGWEALYATAASGLEGVVPATLSDATTLVATLIADIASATR